VVELVRANSQSEHKIEHIKNTPVLRLRNKLLPLIHLRKLLELGEATTEDPDNSGFIVIIQVGAQTFGLVVDGVFHTEEIVVKPMASRMRHITMFSGTTILGDGSVIMIVDPNGIAHAVGSEITAHSRHYNEEEVATITSDQTTSLLVFRSGSAEPKAVPLSLVTRLEEIDAKTIEYSNGRHLAQYRGQLMPLIPVSGETRLREAGMQSLLVFTDDDRSMGLIVDEIVDIVEDRLNIEIASSVPGILGSAVIKGQATEIIDVAHYLPQAFEDWLQRKEMKGEALTRQLLFVDDSAFFRNMLTPVLRAAGYDVTSVPSAEEALALLRSGRRFDMVVSDIEMPEMNGFDFAETLRKDPHHSATPIIALSSLSSPAALERGRQAGFDDYVAKFDRPGLVAALKETRHLENAAWAALRTRIRTTPNTSP